MPVADDDYRRRLAGRQNNRDGEVFNPYAAGFSYLSNFIKENMNPLIGSAEQAKTDPRGALVMAMLGTAGAGGRGKAVRLVDQIPTPVLQRAVQAAALEGRRVGSDFIERAARQPDRTVRLDPDGVARAGRAAEDELFNIIDDLQRIGASSQTVTRGLKGFAKWADEPFEAMEGMGENMSRRTIGFKEALMERMYDRIRAAAERGFF